MPRTRDRRRDLHDIARVDADGRLQPRPARCRPPRSPPPAPALRARKPPPHGEGSALSTSMHPLSLRAWFPGFSAKLLGYLIATFPSPTQAIAVLYIPGLLAPSTPSAPLADRRRAAPPDAGAASRPDISDGAAISNTCRLAHVHARSHGVCQHTCTSDPGPRLVDCAKAEANYEFGRRSLDVRRPADVRRRANARGMYSYTDNSTIIQTFTESATTRTATKLAAEDLGAAARRRCPAAPIKPNDREPGDPHPGRAVPVVGRRRRHRR